MTQKQLEQKRAQARELMKTAIYITEAFHFPPNQALRVINSGMLGYELNADGTTKLDQNNKQIPITIKEVTYYKNKAQFNELPEIYRTLSDFAISGYIKLITGFQKELAYLHKLSIENMLNVKEPLQRQQVIDSLIMKVIPTESGFADMLQNMIKDNPGLIGEPSEDKEE